MPNDVLGPGSGGSVPAVRRDPALPHPQDAETPQRVSADLSIPVISRPITTWREALRFLGIKTIDISDLNNDGNVDDADLDRFLEAQGVDAKVSDGLTWEELNSLSQKYGISVTRNAYNVISRGGSVASVDAVSGNASGDDLVTLSDIEDFKNNVIKGLVSSLGDANTEAVIRQQLSSSRFVIIKKGEAARRFVDQYAARSSTVTYTTLTEHTNTQLKSVMEGVVRKVLNIEGEIPPDTVITREQLGEIFMAMSFLGQIRNPENVFSIAKDIPKLDKPSTDSFLAWFTRGTTGAFEAAESAERADRPGETAGGEAWKKRLDEIQEGLAAAEARGDTNKMLELYLEAMNIYKDNKPEHWEEQSLRLLPHILKLKRNIDEINPQNLQKLYDLMNFVLDNERLYGDMSTTTMVKSRFEAVLFVAEIMKKQGKSATEIQEYMDSKLASVWTAEGLFTGQNRQDFARMSLQSAKFKTELFVTDGTGGKKVLGEGLNISRELTVMVSCWDVEMEGAQGGQSIKFGVFIRSSNLRSNPEPSDVVILRALLREKETDIKPLIEKDSLNYDQIRSTNEEKYNAIFGNGPAPERETGSRRERRRDSSGRGSGRGGSRTRERREAPPAQSGHVGRGEAAEGASVTHTVIVGTKSFTVTQTGNRLQIRIDSQKRTIANNSGGAWSWVEAGFLGSGVDKTQLKAEIKLRFSSLGLP